MDAELADASALVRTLWSARDRADLIVASRYVPGGEARTSWLRRALSRLLNAVYSRAPSVPVRDLSSGYRLYHQRALKAVSVTSTDFAVLPEMLVRLYAEGYRITEVPFQFATRTAQQTLTRFARLAWSYATTLWRLWRLRNSIDSADYDERAFDSILPLQRYWQRARQRIVLEFTGTGGRILDVGCCRRRRTPPKAPLHAFGWLHRRTRIGVRASVRGCKL